MNVRTALLALFVALTIILAASTAYESCIRTTLTPTSTTTSTLIQTTTSALFSSVFLGPHAALVLNSSDGLGLFIQVEPGLNGNYTFTVTESNFLNSVNNITQANDWDPQESLYPCFPPGPPTTLELAVVQGHYGQNNYTSGKALPFYNTSIVVPCGIVVFSGSPTPVYAFQPLNDSVSFYSGSTVVASGAASITFSTSGYWTGGQGNVPAAFRTFGPGVYTVIGADEWGNVVLLQVFLE